MSRSVQIVIVLHPVVNCKQPAEITEQESLTCDYLSCILSHRYNPFGKLLETTANDIDRRIIIRNGTIQCQDDANGSLIAVSYEARASGVKRNDRGLEARLKCPTLTIVQVPVKRGKADLSLYRSASDRVFQVLIDSIVHSNSNNSAPSLVQVEIASIDEVYLDVTDLCQFILNEKHHDWDDLISAASRVTTVGGIETMTHASHVANALKKNEVRKGSAWQTRDATTCLDPGSLEWWNRRREGWANAEQMLAIGASLAAKARAAVFDAFGGVYTLSGGISSNKTLAKLASGFKKPNRQTLIHRGNPVALEKLFYPLPLDRIRGLGGKLGVMVGEKLGVTTLGQLAQVSLVTLTSTFSEDMARFLFDIGRGICRDAVTTRTKPKSISCGKTFRGKLAITDSEILRKWTEELCEGLLERVSADRDQHNRMPKLLMASVHFSSSDSHVSKSCMAPRTLESFSKVCVDLMEKLAATKPDTSIIGLTVAATSFVDVAKGSASITAAFNRTVASENMGFSNAYNVPTSDHGSNRSVKPASAMDRWLQSQSDVQVKKETDCRIVFSSVVSQMADHQGGTIQRFLSNPTLTAPRNDVMCAAHDIDAEVWRQLPEDVRASLQKEWESIPRRQLQPRTPVSSIAKRTSQAKFTTAHDIDPEVWSELPEEIRSSLRREFGAQSKKARTGIASFFLPAER